MNELLKSAAYFCLTLEPTLATLITPFLNPVRALVKSTSCLSLSEKFINSVTASLLVFRRIYKMVLFTTSILNDPNLSASDVLRNAVRAR